MKVIVCGAGQVGYNIARYLAGDKNDVTIIDQRMDLIHKIQDTLDARVVVGAASHPDVLEQAGAEDADLLIAVTATDEANMVACQVAHSLFSVPTKIARIRNQAYLDPLWGKLFSRDDLAIDVIISPEIEVAKAIARRLQLPGATEIIPLADGKVQCIGVRCTEHTPVINTPLRQLSVLFPDLQVTVVAILRGGRPIVPGAEDMIFPGDDVHFIASAAHVKRAMMAFGHEEPQTRRVLILGGGDIALLLAEQIEKRYASLSAKIIEVDRERAEFVAKTLNRTVVMNGDILDPDILQEAGIEHVETVIALTNDDESNLLSALLCKNYGAKRAIVLLTKSTYLPLVSQMGIDVTVDPRGITVSNILHHIRRGRIHSIHTLYDGFGELIEADVLPTSQFARRALRDVKLPPGVTLGAFVRGNEVFTPRGTSVFQAGDRVILFAIAEAVKKVEKMFSVRLEYF